MFNSPTPSDALAGGIGGGPQRVLSATEGGDSWRQLKESQSCDTLCPVLSAGLQQLQKDTVAAAR